ncbi:predicted protein [Aspergillus terreus NIH2624]|uniref:Nucleotide-sugar transporter n=1 Tax=Aspergillus terreus (strain NIH 2624 / FGSC A1156) TaxID=341663 RepID=Q0CWM5_ASPTN|nr:uncharacterized protein ATEG_01909 [Aspergillus terreus NIH2624]EAU36871.1 predicted protein [Aspergillus terreus NIH2624]
MHTYISVVTTCRLNFVEHSKVQVSTIIGLVFLQHSIQSQSVAENKHFDPLTGILLSELLKLTISLLCIDQIVEKPKSLLATLKTNHEEATVPALLYTAASFTQSVGASSLDLLPYLALSQIKLILTPLLATFLLNQRFTLQHWASTLIMTAGILLAQIGANASAENQQHRTTIHAYFLRGIVAMLLSGLSVALGGLFIERSLKRGSVTATTANTFFVRNAQLAAHSVLFALLSFLLKSKCRTDRSSFFEGFTATVWVFVCLQASGGFLVAWCVRATSSVTKNFAQGMGFAIAVLGPLVVESKNIDPKLLVGVVLVLVAVVGSVLTGLSMRVSNLMEKRETNGVV